MINETCIIAGLENLKLYFTEEEVLKYDNEIRYNEGFKDGIEEGKVLGIKEKTKEMVINMYKKNFDIETISQIANLSIDEVNNIIHE